MPEDENDLGEELEAPSEVEEPMDPTTLTVEEWAKRERKLRNEAQSLRRRLARTEIKAEYGEDVLELVPESLPLKEAKELAGKLSARFAASKTQDAPQAASVPEVGIEQPQTVEVEVPQAEPTQAERNLAAVAQGSSPQAASSAQTPLSIDEAAALALRDPAAYQRYKQAGLVKLERLPGNQ